MFSMKKATFGLIFIRRLMNMNEHMFALFIEDDLILDDDLLSFW